MSEWMTIWNSLWGTMSERRAPFEIGTIAPEVAGRLGVKPAEAEREIGFLLEELSRMPEGRRFFRREGNAVVALPEWTEAQRLGRSSQEAYPFEL